MLACLFLFLACRWDSIGVLSQSLVSTGVFSQSLAHRVCTYSPASLTPEHSLATPVTIKIRDSGIINHSDRHKKNTRDCWTERQIDIGERETDTQVDRETDRGRQETDRGRQRDRQTGGQRETDRHTERQTEGNRETDRQVDRKTDRDQRGCWDSGVGLEDVTG